MADIGQDFKWTTAWILADVRQLSQAVHYVHPAGAVIWVNLATDVTSAIEQQLRAVHA